MARRKRYNLKKKYTFAKKLLKSFLNIFCIKEVHGITIFYDIIDTLFDSVEKIVVVRYISQEGICVN